MGEPDILSVLVGTLGNTSMRALDIATVHVGGAAPTGPVQPATVSTGLISLLLF